MKIYRFLVFLCLVLFFHCCFLLDVKAATCPIGKKYAIIQYDHTLRNISTYPGGVYFAQTSLLDGGVGIQIWKQQVTNAGNNKINKQILQSNSSPGCVCSTTPDSCAKSLVEVQVSGSCTNGKLTLHIHEEHPESYATLHCSGSSCSTSAYAQYYPPTATDFDLTMNYTNGYTLTQPYTCPNCSGNYIWKLQFTNSPPPMIPDEICLVPLISPLLLNK